MLATSPTNPTQLVFKRVVGVGGDVIDVPYSNGRNFRATTTRVRVPVGSVWLQGDNARNSTDSRDYGPVPEDMILGRAIARVWPPSGVRMGGKFDGRRAVGSRRRGRRRSDSLAPRGGDRGARRRPR